MYKAIIFVFISTIVFACGKKVDSQSEALNQNPNFDQYLLASPNDINSIQITLDDGAIHYAVNHGDRQVISPSKLGFSFKNTPPIQNNLAVISREETEKDETWKQVWGEKEFVRNHYRQVRLELQETNDTKRKLFIEFRAYDDGVAFRYIYPQQGPGDLVIMDELTEFNLSEDGTAWWIGAYQDNRYEFLTTESLVSELDKVHTPLTIKSKSGTYLSFHEANLVDYASMVLLRTGGTKLKSDLVPWADGDRVKTKGEFTTPWRTIQIADEPGELITSYLILNLNPPNALEDTSWIQPHKYLGIWWGMHIGKYTFWESETQGATNKNAFEYIDYCNKFGIEHLLIEGWNKGWTPAWYENAMHMFSFTDEAEGFDLAEVVAYGKQKGVKIIGYHETGSNLINYRKQVDAGMALYQSLGINDVKIGQVGSRLNMKEWHHGQFGVNYYREILKKAADNKLTVNFHEPIKDTGERRTYPNMMAREGARGQEYNAWSEGNPPSHTAIIPFTRMLSGPMDFTPGVLDVGISQGYEGRDVHTTAAKQLALYVVLYSPIQMLADLPENYDGHVGLKFLQDVPVDWADTKVINADIGKYVTIVRKDKASGDWFLGSLTNEDPREFKITLNFLEDKAKYEAQIYRDADGITWEKGGEKIVKDVKQVSVGDSLDLKLAPGGGTAIRFKKL